jgi:hypothetical protein
MVVPSCGHRRRRFGYATITTATAATRNKVDVDVDVDVDDEMLISKQEQELLRPSSEADDELIRQMNNTIIGDDDEHDQGHSMNLDHINNSNGNSNDNSDMVMTSNAIVVPTDDDNDADADDTAFSAITNVTTTTSAVSFGPAALALGMTGLFLASEVGAISELALGAFLALTFYVALTDSKKTRKQDSDSDSDDHDDRTAMASLLSEAEASTVMAVLEHHHHKTEKTAMAMINHHDDDDDDDDDELQTVSLSPSSIC